MGVFSLLERVLMLPFEKLFVPPVLKTNLSTFPWPNIYFSMFVVFISFIVISSGTIFCFVHGIPLFGYQMTPYGIVTPWISDQGLSSQYLAEGLIAAIIYALGALSLLSGFYLMNHNKTGEFQNILQVFSYTAPLWVMMSLWIFRMKIPSYFPTFGIA